MSASHGMLLVAHGSLRAGSDTALHAVVGELNDRLENGPGRVQVPTGGGMFPELR